MNHPMARRFPIPATFARAGALAAALLVLLAGGATGAELRLRKRLLEVQQNRTLVTVTGEFDHVKQTVNPLKDDCDLHAPIRADEISVAIVGEFMNACSRGLRPHDVEQTTENGRQTIKGVLRVWFEHPGDADEVLTEERPVPDYTSSNPPHAVEIHPILSVGEQDFSATIGPIEKDGEEYAAKGLTQLRTLLRRKVTVQEFDGSDGEPYIGIESGCCLPNYFRLKAAVEAKPQPAAGGGHVAEIRILRGNSVIAKSIRLFSIDGTEADNRFAKLTKGKRFSFWGITRLDLSRILKLAKDDPGSPSAIPVEFVLLAVE